MLSVARKGDSTPDTQHTQDGRHVNPHTQQLPGGMSLQAQYLWNAMVLLAIGLPLLGEQANIAL